MHKNVHASRSVQRQFVPDRCVPERKVSDVPRSLYPCTVFTRGGGGFVSSIRHKLQGAKNPRWINRGEHDQGNNILSPLWWYTVSLIYLDCRGRGCRVDVSPTDVSPTESSWMLRPLNKLSLGYYAPDRSIPTLDHVTHESHKAGSTAAIRLPIGYRWNWPNLT